MNIDYHFNLQLFADEAAAEAENGAAEEVKESQQEEKKSAEQQAKYTDADIDKIIGQKFAEWEKKKAKAVSEAERLSKMTAEEKAAERMKALEEKLDWYEKSAARAEMSKQARALLQDKGIHINDELLANLIAEDAETTKAAVENFLTLFNGAVEKAVKEALKGDVPRAGKPSALTKEQIMSVKNRAERQRLIQENIQLFK